MTIRPEISPLRAVGTRGGSDPGVSMDRAMEVLADHYPSAVDWKIQPFKNSRLFLLEKDGEHLLLKFHSSLCRPNGEQLSALYRICSQRGLSPPIIPTEDGRCLGAIEDGLFSLQKYLVCERMTPAYFRVLPRRLAELHALLACLGGPPIRNHLVRVVPDMREAARTFGYGFLVRVVDKVDAVIEAPATQVVHGDLHPGNLIFHRGGVYFIDLDSATLFPPISDVAFCAFRCSGGDPGGMDVFVERYNHACTSSHMVHGDVWPFVIYNILQRILFILVELENGRGCWFVDLENQKRYLDRALYLWRAASGSPN